VTELEFDILEELYFVIVCKELTETLGIEDNLLKEQLLKLILKDWVKIMEPFSILIVKNTNNFYKRYKEYFTLATKTGKM